MFFQGRGNVFMAALDSELTPGPYNIQLCTDQFAVSLATVTGTHINKCGPVDVEDDRFTKSVSGSIDISFADVADKNFALATLGWVTAADGAPGTVTGEELPVGIAAGDVWFLGGLNRHRAITSLIFTPSLVVTTNYLLDAASGKVTFVTAPVGSPATTAAYGFTDPASVSMLSIPVKSYAFMYEDINKRNNNKAGSVELFRVIFDPAQNIDFQSDDLQIMQLKGSVLANTSMLSSDTEFGQFGRRVL